MMTLPIWEDQPHENSFDHARDNLHEQGVRGQELDSCLEKLQTADVEIHRAGSLMDDLGLDPYREGHEAIRIHTLRLLGHGADTTKLHPVLIVRKDNKLLLGAGGHHLRYAYWLDADVAVPCVIVPA